MTTAAAVPNADQVRHAHWCRPRPGATEPRIESFQVERRDADDRPAGRARTTRCLECGEQVVIG